MANASITREVRGRRPGQRRATVLLSALLVLFGIAPAAWAYTLAGPHWDGTPTSGCCATLNVQLSSSWYTVDKTAVTSAMTAWNDSPANVILQSANGSLTAGDTYDASASWDGITYWGWHLCYPYTRTCFSYANVYLNYYYTAHYSANTNKGIAAHELGHAMGLAHTSGCVLMTPYTTTRNSCGIYGPVTDDVNGINALY